MSNEPSTIVYRSDYVRPGELTSENQELYTRWMPLPSAPKEDEV